MNNTQLIVKTDKATIQWLEQNDYKNAQQLTVENYNFPVIVVDTASKTFFGTNTTCMAAAASCGNTPIVLDFKQLNEKLSLQ